MIRHITVFSEATMAGTGAFAFVDVIYVRVEEVARARTSKAEDEFKQLFEPRRLAEVCAIAGTVFERIGNENSGRGRRKWAIGVHDRLNAKSELGLGHIEPYRRGP